MLTRSGPGGYLTVRTTGVPEATEQLEGTGYAVVKGAFTAQEILHLKAEIESVYEALEPDNRGGNVRAKIADDFRYQMFNRSPACQKIVGRREILDVIEPLIGEDCHIIANTCWRNPPKDTLKHGGGGWHIDAGPHIPLGPGQSWPEDIPHPVFAIGVHIFLEDCPLEAGPTGFIPGSHKSGLHPPHEERMNAELTCNGVGVEAVEAEAGDVVFFVSDIWHRRLPPQSTHRGRFFLQVHYGRRDIAQRVKPTAEINHIDETAITRIESDRERLLLGLHRQGFYDG